MRAIRPGAGAPDSGTAAAPADPLAAAADLRWSRPDLTAALADHVLETAAATDDRDRWLAAAGWAVHARSATGDGRDAASDVIGGLAEWGPGILDGAAAGRLRVELALVAVNAGESGAASALLAPVVAESAEAELRGDAFGVLARCAVEDDPDRVDAALECAELAWGEVGPPLSELGAAAVALVAAAAHRRAARPHVAAERAADGLAELERARGAAGTGPRSGHLAAALAAEWILSLLDAGDTEQARQGCAELAPRLEHSRPSRQLARLRLAVARTNAVGSAVGGTAAETAAHILGQAVRDAAECDAPDLEALCCAALGAVYEKAGRPDFALTTVERGVAAQRRDRSRSERFRAALASLPVQARPAAPAATASGAPAGGPDPLGMTRPLPVGPGAEPVTAMLPTTGGPDGTRGGADRGRRSRHGLAVDRAWQLGEYAPAGDDEPRDQPADDEASRDSGAPPAGGGGSRGPTRTTADRPDRKGRAGRAEADQRPGGRSAVWDVRWDDVAESPIGDSLMRTMRSDGTPAPSSNGHRARRTPAAGSPDAARTELLRVTDADADASDRDEPEAPGSTPAADPTGPANRHRLDSGINPIPATRRRTATEELEARRAAAGRKESAPAAFSAEWLAAELADLERIWERISQPVVRPEPGETPAHADATERAADRPARRSRTGGDPAESDHDSADHGGADHDSDSDSDNDNDGSNHDGSDHGGADEQGGLDDSPDSTDRPRRSGGRRRAEQPAGADPARPVRARRRFGAAGDSKPGGATPARSGLGRPGADYRVAAVPTGAGEGRIGRRRAADDPVEDEPSSVDAATDTVIDTATDTVIDTATDTVIDSATAGATDGDSGPSAPSWTATRSAGRGLPGMRRRAGSEPAADDPAEPDERRERSPGWRSGADSDEGGRPRGGRRRAEPDVPSGGLPEPTGPRRRAQDPEASTEDEPSSRRRDEVDDEPAGTATGVAGSGDAPDQRDGTDGADRRGGAPTGRRRAVPRGDEDGAEPGGGRPAGRRSMPGQPAPGSSPRSSRGVRQAAIARAETTMLPAVRPKSVPPAPSVPPADAADAALFGPLPDELLDPVLAEPPAPGPAPVSQPVAQPRPGSGPSDADGCVVGIDIAREGRRLVGRRSAEVLRAVAEALRGHLPPDGRIEEGEAGVLTVLAPGWSRDEATGWMRSRLPGVLDGVVCEVDPAGMSLRAAVRDGDGPVGAQLLQRLDAPAGPARREPDAPVGRPP
ncbi:hypothetical protein, partial [Pseudonocardia lacus]|uniref:hypothetical protein n=1 Tax=Pseudonocardia lacus TaxID=2835865 RepID=UPI0038B49BF9